MVQLLTAFDYGDLEEFQQYFSMLDIDNSGDLSGKEIRVLLRALDIKVQRITSVMVFVCFSVGAVLIQFQDCLFLSLCLMCLCYSTICQISELKFNKLLKTVDLNGNGTIEFDEYCWMVSTHCDLKSQPRN